MEKQELIIESNLKTVFYKGISGFMQGVDRAAFKVVIDYIVRNFDPTGINIAGLIDSFCYVLIKPMLSSFVKMVKRGTDRCRELAVNLRKSSPESKFDAMKVLCYGRNA